MAKSASRCCATGSWRRAAAAFWSQTFPNRFAMEIHQAGFEDEHHLNEHSVRLATEAGLPWSQRNPMRLRR